MNKRYDNTHTCLLPCDTGNQFVKSTEVLTALSLLPLKALILSNNCPFTIYSSSTIHSCVLFTRSEALSWSINETCNSLSYSIDFFKQFCLNAKLASVHPLALRNPNWYSVNRSSNLFLLGLSKNFHTFFQLGWRWIYLMCYILFMCYIRFCSLCCSKFGLPLLFAKEEKLTFPFMPGYKFLLAILLIFPYILWWLQLVCCPLRWLYSFGSFLSHFLLFPLLCDSILCTYCDIL